MAETHIWRREYTYYEEPGAAEMARCVAHETLKHAQEIGKIKRIIGEPKFVTVEGDVPNYFKVVVTAEIEIGETFDWKKAKEFTLQ